MTKVAEIEPEVPAMEGSGVAPSSGSMSDGESEMESAFTDTRTDISTEPAASPAVGDAVEETPAAPEPIYAKITEDDYKRFLTNAETVEKIASSLEQRFGTAFGHIGGLQQKLKEMQDATPRGQAVKLTKEDFAELQADFPELADLQMKGLERVLSRVSGTGIDESKASELVEARLGAFKTQILKDTLTDLHEDWETVVGKQGSQTPYRTWLATQPQAEQDRINGSHSPRIIAESITKFKAFTAAPHTSSRPNAAAEARRAELRSAVTPRGGGGVKVGKTEEDELQEAFDNA